MAKQQCMHTNWNEGNAMPRVSGESSNFSVYFRNFPTKIGQRRMHRRNKAPVLHLNEIYSRLSTPALSHVRAFCISTNNNANIPWKCAVYSLKVCYNERTNEHTLDRTKVKCNSTTEIYSLNLYLAKCETHLHTQTEAKCIHFGFFFACNRAILRI